MHDPYNHNDLKIFLRATDPSEMMQLAKKLQHQYAFDYHIASHSDTIDTDMLSPLEVAAQLGKSQHVLVLLQTLRTASNVRQLKNAIAHSHNDIETLACLRALKHGKAETAAIFLHNPKVLDDLAGIKIRPVGSSSGLGPRSFVTRMQKPHNYPISYNDIPAEGNVALVLAARLSDARIFNLLLRQSVLAEQLPDSALVAFLAATRNNDGTEKIPINQEVVFKLLSIPEIHSYATERWYDFHKLLETYNQQQVEQVSFQPIVEVSDDNLTDAGSLSPVNTDTGSPMPPSVISDVDADDDMRDTPPLGR